MSKLPRIWLPVAVTGLGFAVRLYNLTYHSLWFDEAMSVHWARSSVARILEVSMKLVEDRLPPLYYLGLHYWRLLVGDGEVAVRLPSALLGTLLVAVVYRLTGDVLDRRAAALAALLTALNPFLVWYSQEARMYAQAALLVSLGTWLFLQAAAHRRPAPVYWFAYSLCALAGLYTHLYTGFALLAHAVYLLIAPHRSRQLRMAFGLSMLAVAVLFSPLALATWRASAEAGPGDPLASWWARLWRLLSAFSVWKAPLPSAWQAVIPATIAALAAAGLLLPDRPALQRRPLGTSRPRLLLALLLFTPLAMATLLLTRSRIAFFGERYFITMVPWLLIAVAVGAVTLAAYLRAFLATTGGSVRIAHYWLPAACYLLPILFSLLPLPGQWSPAARKEAWRETVGYLATHARPEDAILIHPDWTRYPLQYYFRGPGQTYAVFGSVTDNTDLEGPLTAISHQHPIFWLIESHTELADPEHRVNAWLAARYPIVTELYPPGLAAVHAYAPGYLLRQLPHSATPLNLAFAGGLQLAGFTVPETRVSARDDLFHPPSGWVHVTLYWTAEAHAAQSYAPFVHLIDDLGQVWGASLERPNDAFDFYPPARWEAGQVVRSDFDVNLNPVTPPGRYMLVVGLRDASGVQSPLSDGSPQAPLLSVEVTK